MSNLNEKLSCLMSWINRFNSNKSYLSSEDLSNGVFIAECLNTV
jgi:hypothetical protein